LAAPVRCGLLLDAYLCGMIPTRLRDDLDLSMHPRRTSEPVEWVVSDAAVGYPEAVAAMEARAAEIAAGTAAERVWLVEHPPLYTAGSSARDGDLKDARFPVFHTGRGGQFTYHGPGQRVAYVMLDLNRRSPDLRGFVAGLESWIIGTLAALGVRGERRENRVGVWVARPHRPAGPAGEAAEDKIAAIGIRVRRWVTFHGISLNVRPDLSHFGGIVPCGVSQAHLGVTSLADLGLTTTMAEADAALRDAFTRVLGPTVVPARDRLVPGCTQRQESFRCTLHESRPDAVRRRTGADLDRIDAGSERSLPKCRQTLVDGSGRTREDSLNPTGGEIPHPAAQAQSLGPALGPGPVADPLDASENMDANDLLAGFAHRSRSKGVAKRGRTAATQPSDDPCPWTPDRPALTSRPSSARYTSGNPASRPAAAMPARYPAGARSTPAPVAT
jgi:lipoyl(octanoyl) transferase